MLTEPTLSDLSEFARGKCLRSCVDCTPHEARIAVLFASSFWRALARRSAYFRIGNPPNFGGRRRRNGLLRHKRCLNRRQLNALFEDLINAIQLQNHSAQRSRSSARFSIRPVRSSAGTGISGRPRWRPVEAQNRILLFASPSEAPGPCFGPSVRSLVTQSVGSATHGSSQRAQLRSGAAEFPALSDESPVVGRGASKTSVVAGPEWFAEDFGCYRMSLIEGNIGGAERIRTAG